MNLQEYENFYHVDISTQIENKWLELIGLSKDNRAKSKNNLTLTAQK